MSNMEMICPKCGAVLARSEVEGYTWSCEFCDEDFYGFEVETNERLHDGCREGELVNV